MLTTNPIVPCHLGQPLYQQHCKAIGVEPKPWKSLNAAVREFWASAECDLLKNDVDVYALYGIAQAANAPQDRALTGEQVYGYWLEGVKATLKELQGDAPEMLPWEQLGRPAQAGYTVAAQGAHRHYGIAQALPPSVKAKAEVTNDKDPTALADLVERAEELREQHPENCYGVVSNAEVHALMSYSVASGRASPVSVVDRASGCRV